MDRAARDAVFVLFLISLAITVTINFRWLYHFDIQQLNILDYTDISKEELIKNYGLLLDFLNNPLNTTLALPDFPMSAAGAGHFYDVKKLFLLNYGVLLVTLIPSFMLLRSFGKMTSAGGCCDHCSGGCCCRFSLVS
ncbi:integral membrane protein [Enterococcus sp. HSIEG1]|nr:integral membrane protein [Enterococcus sp. HSIEG1]